MTTVAVIGAGVVGICCGISLRLRGCEVTLYDPEPPGSQTSAGNAGGFGFTDVMPMAGPGIIRRVPGWLLDPCGPLFVKPSHFLSLVPWLWHFHRAGSRTSIEHLSRALTEILRASESDTKSLVRQAGMQSQFTELGALTVYRSRDAFEKDHLEWQVKQDCGVEARKLTAHEIQDMEPALRNANYGWFTPQWCNTPDPYRFTTSLGEFFVSLGGCFDQRKVKCLLLNGSVAQGLVLENDQKIQSDSVVVAAGVWSKQFADQVGDRVLLESERGYNTTLPAPGVTLNRQVIFGEEKFVISKIGNGLRIGGAAEFAGLQAPPNFKRSEKLLEVARRYLPDLNDSNGSQWMGHRPTTPDSIPVIGASPETQNLVYAFGHGHYGLTMAATTGKAVASLLVGEAAGIDLGPFAIDRFA